MSGVAVELSDHAYERMKERSGLSRKAAAATAQKAYERGVTHAETKGRLRKYFGWRSLEYGGSNARIYGNFFYIFQGPRLVTVWPLPHRLEKLVQRKATQ